jgi:hypothetical protein
MTFEEILTSDMKTAMKAKDKEALEAIRAIRAAILNAKTEAGAGGEFKEEDSLKLLQKLKKQRQDALEIYKEQGREDLASTEESQLRIIEAYLPEMMDPKDVEEHISKAITEMGASGMGDMGRVMGRVTKELSGKAEGKTIADTVRRLLS